MSLWGFGGFVRRGARTVIIIFNGWRVRTLETGHGGESLREYVSTIIAVAEHQRHDGTLSIYDELDDGQDVDSSNFDYNY